MGDQERMSLAVVSLALGKAFQQQAMITQPSMRQYASKIGAEFIVIDDQKISTVPYFEKFRIYDILGDFDRIIFLDNDTIVRHDCPSLFEVVPSDMLGMYDGGLMANREEEAVHREIMTRAMREYFGEPLPDSWRGEFFNTGVIVASRCHRDLFKKPEKELVMPCLDQAYFDAMLLRENIPVFDIGYKFNRMAYVDKVAKRHRLHSYIIHYAGNRRFDYVAKKDLAAWDLARTTPGIRFDPPPKRVLFRQAGGYEMLDLEGSMACDDDIAIRDEYKLRDVLIPEGKVIIDAGANCGLFSAWATKKWPGTRVFALEPLRENFDSLVMNVERLGLKGIKCLNLALTGDGRSVQVSSVNDMTSLSSIYGNPLADTAYVNMCRSITLDALLEENGIEEVALLKMDIEGAEFEVLYGFKAWHKIKRLVAEVHGGDSRVASKRNTFKELESFVKDKVQHFCLFDCP